MISSASEQPVSGGKDTAGDATAQTTIDIYWEGFRHGTEAAAKFIEDCRDYGWQELAAHIRSMAPAAQPSNTATVSNADETN